MPTTTKLFPNFAHDDSNGSSTHSLHKKLFRDQIEYEVRVISMHNWSRYPDEVTTYDIKS